MLHHHRPPVRQTRAPYREQQVKDLGLCCSTIMQDALALIRITDAFSVTSGEEEDVWAGLEPETPNNTSVFIPENMPWLSSTPRHLVSPQTNLFTFIVSPPSLPSMIIASRPSLLSVFIVSHPSLLLFKVKLSNNLWDNVSSLSRVGY